MISSVVPYSECAGIYIKSIYIYIYICSMYTHIHIYISQVSRVMLLVLI